MRFGFLNGDGKFYLVPAEFVGQFIFFGDDLFELGHHDDICDVEFARFFVVIHIWVFKIH